MASNLIQLTQYVFHNQTQFLNVKFKPVGVTICNQYVNFVNKDILSTHGECVHNTIQQQITQDVMFIIVYIVELTVVNVVFV